MAKDGALAFLKIRAVPHLFWSAPRPLTIRPPAISVAMLAVGLVLFGLGEALLIASGVGVSPWTVLAQGITNITGWSVGLATFVISVTVLLAWIPLRQTPGIGTILNIIIIAVVLDLALPWLPQFESLALRVAEAAAGVIVTGIGGGIYLIANLGPGPRDGLMTGLQRLSGFPIAGVRSAIEIGAVALGWSLGGVVGIGTLLFAFGIGPAVAAAMYGLQRVLGGDGENG
ncbi:MAG: YczE/YyaS/YitT family protein [Candidatus Puniceispirillaceae bacterium]